MTASFMYIHSLLNRLSFANFTETLNINININIEIAVSALSSALPSYASMTLFVMVNKK